MDDNAAALCRQRARWVDLHGNQQLETVNSWRHTAGFSRRIINNKVNFMEKFGENSSKCLAK
uniref:Uncharacterized protein n=1 Tax=Megaselia scalaris TaxID=36166 RepID=T1GNA9_MEGSC